ncbi:hypothetical protein CN527_14950 [Bacillus cereus]|nr:hypothetical protein CN527_14950 [Bacillus cereus]
MEQDFENQVQQLIELLNTLKPEQCLLDCISAATPHFRDLDLISNAKDYQKLPEPVINALIHYVIIKTDVLVLHPIFSDIAADWSRKGIKTVEEAMAMAKQENKTYEKWIRKYREDSWLGNVLRGAIISGMTDQELGKYVRQLQKEYL